MIRLASRHRHQDGPDMDERPDQIEGMVAERAAAEAFRWRFRLIVTETLMIAILVALAGSILHKPFLVIARAAIGMAAACLASGMLLIGLSGLGSHCMAALGKWWRR